VTTIFNANDTISVTNSSGICTMPTTAVAVLSNISPILST
jgi:hypothetical protein